MKITDTNLVVMTLELQKEWICMVNPWINQI